MGAPHLKQLEILFIKQSYSINSSVIKYITRVLTNIGKLGNLLVSQKIIFKMLWMIQQEN